VSEPIVKVYRERSIGWIELNQPEARNPLNRESAQLIADGFFRHSDDDTVRSIVITGVGKAFCAGGDLRQMGAFRTMGTDEAFSWPEPIVRLHRASLQSKKPLIAAVNGPAFAGGMGLAGMCDVILATETARFAMPEVKVGIFPMIIVAHLCRALPRKRLLEMMFSGEPLEAVTAERLGFVSKLYPDVDALRQGARAYAAKFDRASPYAVALGRRAFNLLADMPADQAIDAAQFLVMPFHLGDDMSEGAAAFLRGGDPSWVPGQPEGD
jgi:enoyl-CoA hydratase/carnithine racemase